MEFKDFINNPQDLLYKSVLYEFGQSYASSLSKRICEIDKVTKTGFRIAGFDTMLFSFIDGRQKGLGGRQNMGTVSRCELLTPAQVHDLRMEWRMKREMKEMATVITNAIPTLTHTQLTAIVNSLKEK